MEKVELETIKLSWLCPSNIAIVKYWGKTGNQIPCNSSLSMTLSKSFTELDLELIPKTSKENVALDYFFEGKKNIGFEERVRNYLIKNQAEFSFLNNYGLKFNSKNSFPHSAGIASSASAFGAIALALLDAEEHFKSEKLGTASFLKKASNLARLGSGSASRSMYGGYALWGYNEEVSDSSNEYAIEVNDVHENFKEIHDAILIVESEPKKVSSSIGHSLMNEHPYAKMRFDQANKRTVDLINILKSGDYEQFIEIAESEALTLHAMMLTSKKYYMLFKAGTILAINKIMDFRKETNIPICFTLDAGPNVHVLYPGKNKLVVEEFLKNNLNNCVQEIIFDELGFGPIKQTRIK